MLSALAVASMATHWFRALPPLGRVRTRLLNQVVVATPSLRCYIYQLSDGLGTWRLLT